MFLSIEKEIREKIASGEWQRGDKLVNEYNLAEKFNTSRPTLRKALVQLKKDGYIVQIPGRGTIISSPDNHDFKFSEKKHSKAAVRRIAVLIPSIDNLHYPKMIRGIEDYFHRQNFQVILGNCDTDPAKEKKYIETCMEDGLCGIILAPGFRSLENIHIYNALKEKKISIVIIDTPVRNFNASLVATDNIAGAYAGTMKLLQSGCRKLIFLSGWLKAESSCERLTGFKKALSEMRIAFDENNIYSGSFTEQFGYETALQMLQKKQNIDGIFSANHPITYGLLRAFRETNQEKIKNITIATFDGEDIFPYTGIKMICIIQQKYRIGYTASEKLYEMIRHGKYCNDESTSKILFTPEIKQNFKTS
ncbi:MAG: hypothetical protein A2096_15440 [Spirochaetes bacterium GWF1_41_5]|nr:MAG: hypothetical protein A2096_15440 [Spirochaetes bacterium GWF1_41_5]